MLSNDTEKALRNAGRKVTYWTTERDRLVKEAVAEGGSLREVGAAAGISHTAVKCAGRTMTTEPLYAVQWNGTDDYLPDAALDAIAQRILAHLPDAGFDVPSTQAHKRSVTATVAFDGIEGPMAQQAALDAMCHAATVVRTLHANLIAARKALTDRRDEDRMAAIETRLSGSSEADR